MCISVIEIGNLAEFWLGPIYWEASQSGVSGVCTSLHFRPNTFPHRSLFGFFFLVLFQFFTCRYLVVFLIFVQGLFKVCGCPENCKDISKNTNLWSLLWEQKPRMCWSTETALRDRQILQSTSPLTGKIVPNFLIFFGKKFWNLVKIQYFFQNSEAEFQPGNGSSSGLV